MYVVADKRDNYELPVCVGVTIRECAQQLKVKERMFSMQLARHTTRETCKYRFLIIKVKEDE